MFCHFFGIGVIQATRNPVTRESILRQAMGLFVAQHLHAILDAPGELRTSLPERRMSAADILITVRPDAGQLTTTTTHTS